MTEQNYFTMDNKDLRKLIVQDLKDLGIERKDYSLSVKNCSLDKAIDIIIKSPYINIREITNILQKYERVDYCSITNEILQGCNVYLNITYDYEAFDNVSDEYLELANNSFKELDKLQESYGYKVFENDTNTMLIFKSNNTIIAYLKDNLKSTNIQRIVNDVEHLSINIFKALNHGFIA